MLRIDLTVEDNTAHTLRHVFGKHGVHALGEESLRSSSIDLSGDNRLIVLLDMIDGTDLLARGLSNWCSAMVFFKNGTILAAFIGILNEGIYYATSDREGAYVKRENAIERRVCGPNRSAKMAEASICFYGQKPTNFLAVAEHDALRETLRRMARKESGPRIYNLAGNPMMMRLIDGQRRIDAIFDIEGQMPHDVVPGAWIAQKAGAVLCDISGKRISLGASLLRPAHEDSELRYVLAASKTLAKNLQKVLNTKPIAIKK